MRRSRLLGWQDRIGAAILLLAFSLISHPAHAQGRIYWVEPAQSLIKSVDIQGNNPQVNAKGFRLEELKDLDADADGWLYWTSEWGGYIGRSRPDGSDPQSIVEGVNAYGISVDRVNGLVYWAETYNKVIRRSRLDGSDAVDVLTGIGANALRVFPEEGRIFWTVYPSGTYGANLDGSNVTRLSDNGYEYLALDKTTQTLFVSSGKQIIGFGLSGENPRVVVEMDDYIYALTTEEGGNRLCWGFSSGLACSRVDGTQVSILTSAPRANGLSIDPKSRLITMAASGPAGRLMRCRPDGSNLEMLIDPVISPQDVAVDPADGKLYWADDQWYYHNLIWRSDQNGSLFESLGYSPQDPLSWGALTTIAVDPVRRRVYVGGKSHGLFSAGGIVGGPMAGSISETIVPNDWQMKSILDIAVDPATGDVYYSSGSAHRVKPDGSGDTTVVDQAVHSLALMLEDPASGRSSRLFWLNGSEIWSSTLDGSDRKLVVSNLDEATSLGADAETQHIVWIDGSGNIMRARPDGSEITLIARGGPGAMGMAIVSSPSSVSLVYPVSLAEDVPTSLDLSWTVPPMSGRSDVQVARAENPAEIIFAQNTPHTQVHFTAPETESEYIWRARFVGVGGAGPWTTWSLFSVGSVGDLAVELVSPEDGATGVALPVTLGWSSAPLAAGYRLQVSETASFDSLLVDIDTLTATNHEAIGLEHARTYFWRVAGVGESGSSTVSQPHSFTTIIAAPEAVALVGPAAGEAGVPAYAEFSWQGLDDADSYTLEVATDESFTQLVESLELSGTAFALDSPLDYDTVFFWRVRAANEGGMGPWSEVRSFKTAIGTAVGRDGLPSTFSVTGWYPNPFSAITRLGFELPASARVKLTVFDVLGHEIEIVVDDVMAAGRHEAVFDGTRLPSGTYIARIEGAEFSQSMVLTVVR